MRLIGFTMAGEHGNPCNPTAVSLEAQDGEFKDLALLPMASSAS